ncbi:hypothetical protein TRFO_32871 [Tritrichomonas foetus]|uniref:Protein kinase domain-containing protein n=1 Tax=Tritrichomonas foetus TaxID=1144522 RepID=A0A1J4JMW3_9EUKA|nr:hypothetical protein TRFO_32871 [Tritrichomonas foetus]|eukprot:OHT00463.1 hypothetical protein TRFO_32871 [Tritrichomonas foetus]
MTLIFWKKNGYILYIYIKTNIQGHLPFDDPSIRNLMIKVKNGRYQMPPFIPEIQDLIARMLVVDPTKRLTIDQIKEHPAFHIGLPKNYTIPKPLPLPFLPDPINVESLDPKIYTVLVHLGYNDEEEIHSELESSSHNMAKVFCHILTSTFSFDSLPWDDNGTLSHYPSEAFLVESQQAFTSSADPFTKKLPPLSAGSPDLFSSVVEKTQWPTDNEMPADTFEGGTIISSIKLPLLQLITGIQQMLTTHMFKFFYPNDFTIITKHPDDLMYIVIIASLDEDDSVSLNIQHKNGSIVLFSTFVQMVQDLINSFS